MALALGGAGVHLGLGRDGEVRFRVGARAMRARWAADGRAIELVFGVVGEPAEPWTIEVAGRRFEGRWVTAGVPHFVVPVERVEWVPVAEWGAALRHHPRFGPAGANVDFVSRLNAGRIAMRTYERGVEAETLACGSGAIASALWAALQGERSPVSVVTGGGDELVVSFRRLEDGFDVTLGGPAEVAFQGEWVERAAEPVGL